MLSIAWSISFVNFEKCDHHGGVSCSKNILAGLSIFFPWNILLPGDSSVLDLPSSLFTSVYFIFRWHLIILEIVR